MVGPPGFPPYRTRAKISSILGEPIPDPPRPPLSRRERLYNLAWSRWYRLVFKVERLFDYVRWTVGPFWLGFIAGAVFAAALLAGAR